MAGAWTEEKELIEEAGNAFCLGIQLQDISDRLGISVSKLQRWRNKYNWVERKVEFETKLSGMLQLTFEIMEKTQARLKEALNDYDEDLGDIGTVLALFLKMQAQFEEQRQHMTIDPIQVALTTMLRFQQYLSDNDLAAHQHMATHVEGFIANLQTNPPDGT